MNNRLLLLQLLLLLVSFQFLSLKASAQTIIDPTSLQSLKADSIHKKIIGNADYLVVYDYQFVPDSNFPLKKRGGQTYLQISKEYNRFGDYNQLRYDSLIDVSFKNRDQKNIEEVSLRINLLKSVRFNESIIYNIQKNKLIVQRTAGSTTRYQYEEDCPKLDWTLLDGDTIISGYQCFKASTRLFGRGYIAWYCPEISMTYGPYKFNGLPGLVLRVTDTQGHHDFTLNGLKAVSGYNPIYFWNRKDIVKTKRETVRKIYKNSCDDPTEALVGDGAVTISEETRAKVKSNPYNLERCICLPFANGNV